MRNISNFYLFCIHCNYIHHLCTLLIPFFLVPIPSGTGPTSTMVIKNDYASRGAFEGWLDFDITEPTLGFVMAINFSKPVAQIHVRFFTLDRPPWQRDKSAD